MADLAEHEEDIVVEPMPVGSAGRKSSGWYGMLALIVTEGSLFVYLLFSFYYSWIWGGDGFLPGERPSLWLSGPDTVILILSSVAAWWGERGVKQGRRGWQLPLGIAIAIVLGIVFLVVQLYEWKDKTFAIDTSPYGSLYFTITGFHMAHVAVGVLVLLALFVWALLGLFDPRRHAPVTIGIIYWHFVDVVWLFIFFTFYITPYLS
ncbi:MAG TPA: cytochrome c oxidase subunit 3 [Devosia sp.]|nr:cytochrome c oxidase subunit 3 [Devosia sp.]